jgi:hypothetical protein
MLKVELVDWETWFELGLEGKCPLFLEEEGEVGFRGLNGGIWRVMYLQVYVWGLAYVWGFCLGVGVPSWVLGLFFV